jgi:hypothetical protein
MHCESNPSILDRVIRATCRDTVAIRFGFTFQTARVLSCPAKAGHPAFQRPFGSSVAAAGILDRPVKPGDDDEENIISHSRGTFLPG